MKFINQKVMGIENETVVKNVVMKFSPDSKRLAIYMKETNRFIVVSISDDIEADFGG